MWNYNLVLPELVISATFFIYYFSQSRLPLRISRAFLFILFIDTLTILTDVISSLCLEYLSSLPPFALRVQNVIFFILFLQRIICFTMFTNIVLKKDAGYTALYKVVNLLPFIIITFLVVLNLFTDVIFCISDAGEYRQGPLYFMIYVCAFYYVVLSIVGVLISYKRLNRGDFFSLLIMNVILFIGYIMRITYPRHLIMNFFTLISIIVIYLSFENPALFKEEKSGVFNKKALILLLNEMRAERYPLVLGFSIRNYKNLREIYSYSQTDKGLLLIGNYLRKTFPNLMPFYIHDGHFVLIGKNDSEAGNIRKTITERFALPWNTDKDIDMLLEISFAQVNPDIIPDNKSLLCYALISSLNEIDEKLQASVIINIDDINNIERKILVKRAVENAIDQNSVELFLQPVLDANTHKLIGAESLARIKDEKGEYIPPVQFIPVAEKNGRITALGEQMFEKTCQFIKESNFEELGLSWINVNLSPIQFLRRDLNKNFMAILHKYDVSPEKIHLEITEESMIDFDLLQTQMHIMKISGFRFVLDDYGRGYSNIARMKKCPFINVKIDMEFVWDYFKYKDKILPTLVQTIKQMGFTVTAEGIENLEMANALRDIGCDNLQGFYFSRPLPAKEFLEKYGKKHSGNL